MVGNWTVLCRGYLFACRNTGPPRIFVGMRATKIKGVKSEMGYIKRSLDPTSNSNRLSSNINLPTFRITLKRLEGIL